MKNDLDAKIREALRQEEAEFLDEFAGEPSLFELVAETFKGRTRWLNIFVVLWTLVFTVAGIFSVVKLFQADDNVHEHILWALATVFCLLAIMMFKLWYWMELNKHAITREIKRLELQVARLAARLGKQDESE